MVANYIKCPLKNKRNKKENKLFDFEHWSALPVAPQRTQTLYSYKLLMYTAISISIGG